VANKGEWTVRVMDIHILAYFIFNRGVDNDMEQVLLSV